jgi:Zn-dependent peptidase ImmA (M78 family)/DNA-binding XRE family transcriptional regulator
MFNASRLSIARQRRQFTKKALAEQAGVTSLTLTRIESGETHEPAIETVAAIAKVLNFPIDFFYGDDAEQLDPDTVSFRSLSTLSAKQKDAALAAGQVALMLNAWIGDRFVLPDAALLDLSGENPAAAATSMRSHWGIGAKPITSLIRLLESKGIRVFSLEENNKNVNAFSFWKKGVPFIFLNTYKSPEASRFDAAHELGHLVLHVNGTFRNKDNEREADRFAGEFLMPEGDVIGHVPKTPNIAKLIELKSRWGVSVAALARTTFEIGLSSDWHYRELCKQLAMRGYRTNEPKSIDREVSTLWRLVFEQLWRDGITREDVADAIGIPRDEVFSLLQGIVSGPESQENQPVKQRPSLQLV